MDYKVKKIQEKLISQKEEFEAKLEAWEKVEVKTKKDGSDFKTLGKAIIGAKLQKEIPADNMHPYIEIYAKTASGKYITDSLPVFLYLDELPNTDERKKDYVRQFLRQTTNMHSTEIRESIDKKISYYKNCIENLEKQIPLTEKVYNNYVSAIEKANKQLDENSYCNDRGFSFLAYEIRNSVNYRY